MTREQIEQVLWSLNDDKAPCPDGYNAHFFKRAWSVIGDEMLCVMKDFFDNGSLLREINSTAIALVPKVQNPSRVSDFRPFSCCNTLYK